MVIGIENEIWKQSSNFNLYSFIHFSINAFGWIQLLHPQDRLDSLALSGSQYKRISEFKNGEVWENHSFPKTWQVKQKWIKTAIIIYILKGEGINNLMLNKVVALKHMIVNVIQIPLVFLNFSFNILGFIFWWLGYLFNVKHNRPKIF